MKIFTSTQIHELDRYTIEHEPISSLNLMERAAKAITRSIEKNGPAVLPLLSLPVLATMAVMRLRWPDYWQKMVILFRYICLTYIINSLQTVQPIRRGLQNANRSDNLQKLRSTLIRRSSQTRPLSSTACLAAALTSL